jgi:hypothetical protein
VIVDILGNHNSLLSSVSHVSILRVVHMLLVSWLGVLVTWNLSLDLICISGMIGCWLGCWIICVHWPGGIT